MSTKLCIKVSSAKKPKKLEFDFLFNEVWTQDTEAVLLQRLHEILSLLRPAGTSLRVNLEVDVSEPEQALFLIKKKLNQFTQSTIRNYTLSAREAEVLAFIMQGYTNQQIAAKLFISYETVKSHRKHILTKTGAPNTAALINYYHQTFFEK